MGLSKIFYMQMQEEENQRKQEQQSQIIAEPTFASNSQKDYIEELLIGCTYHDLKKIEVLNKLHDEMLTSEEASLIIEDLKLNQTEAIDKVRDGGYRVKAHDINKAVREAANRDNT